MFESGTAQNDGSCICVEGQSGNRPEIYIL